MKMFCTCVYFTIDHRALSCDLSGGGQQGSYFCNSIRQQVMKDKRGELTLKGGMGMSVDPLFLPLPSGSMIQFFRPPL